MRTILDRRTFLRGAGVALALPLLESTAPRASGQAQPKPVPRRLVAIHTNQGIIPQHFFPADDGPAYALSPYLQLLKDHRSEFTVFSGVSHPQVEGSGHQAEPVFLTGAPRPGQGGFRNTVSLDQLAAESLGEDTRFATLVLGTGDLSISYTRSGVMIPAVHHPGELYRQLFVQGTPQEIERRVEELRQGRSLLDSLEAGAGGFATRFGVNDRERLDQYLTSVRDLEKRLKKAEVWERKPKPATKVPPPPDAKGDVLLRAKLLYGLIRLALETDATRLVTLYTNMTGQVPNLPGVKHEVHELTHQGAPDELKLIEQAQLKTFSDFLTDLKGVREAGKPLLDRTMVLYGSCMGSAASHSNVNLPVLLAGGGFKHGQHLAFDRRRNYPLPNLFVSMLQRLGVEADRFATSTGTMRGLEFA